jgi:hypothetical protein
MILSPWLCFLILTTYLDFYLQYFTQAQTMTLTQKPKTLKIRSYTRKLNLEPKP